MNKKMKNSPIEKMSNWVKNSISLKLTTITILMLLLLIPTAMVKSIIKEREELNAETIADVSTKWANGQQINGPILVIPLVYESKKWDKTTEVVKNWYVLPEELGITSKITPKKLSRGIYDVVVYKSEVSLNGTFRIEENIDQANLLSINYDQAFITIGISDLRGIEDNLHFKWDNELLNVEPGSRVPGIVYSGVTIDITNAKSLLQQPISFNLDLKLQGSQFMSFVPLGSTTIVNVKSDWPAPSFGGNFLPDTREVTDSGFVAEWKILQLNRNFSQSWIGDDHEQGLHDAAFSVNLLLPPDNYKKSLRSAKYAVMTISLTFLAFFLVEIIKKRRIHPFQYTLVGLALILFYVLLVSITEHANFNFAYTISSISIVSMISLYSLSVFRNRRITLILTLILTSVYGFLFITLQLTDYALLMGSLGLTVILGLTMYFTRKIDWYNLNKETS